MSVVIFDTETTIYESGDPFSNRNRLCYVGFYEQGRDICVGTDAFLPVTGQALFSASCVVGFNLKFDLHWIRRYGYGVGPHTRIWDCQYAHFLLTAQRSPYPSLNEVLEYYGLEPKFDKIEREYWSRGVDTPDIPQEEMLHYLAIDLKRTMEVYEKQVEDFKNNPKLYRLFQLHMLDTLVLADMEWNGIKYATEASLKKAREVQEEIESIYETLSKRYPSIPINFSSPHQLSAFLYGGVIKWTEKELVGEFKTGGKKGQPKFKNVVREETLFRLCNPPENSELAKEGYWSVGEEVLKKIKKPPKEVQLILKLAELDKLNDYLKGLPEKIQEKDWSKGILHGRFNQCVARTGRLSSSEPNLQNLHPTAKSYCIPHNEVFIDVDCKALEWCGIVFLSKDKVGYKEINGSIDQHSENQLAFNLPDRLTAKKFTFRMIYGGTEFSYPNDPEFSWISSSPKYWKKVIEAFYSKYEGIRLQHVSWIRQAATTGKLIMPTGRWYKFEPTNGNWPETKIKNYPVQGFGHDMVTLVRVMLAKALKKAFRKHYNNSVRLVATVHDSIVIDTTKRLVNRIMIVVNHVFKAVPETIEKVFGFAYDLPFKFEACVGPNLEETEEYAIGKPSR